MMLLPSRFSSPALVRLNPDYCARHAVVPLGWNDGRLVLAMADTDDQETIAALSLATGYAVDPVSLSTEAIRTVLGAGRTRATAPDWALLPAAQRRRGTFPARRRIGQRCNRGAAFLLPLAELLDAGYDPVEAAGVVTLSRQAGERLDPVLSDLAARLAAGTPLEQALRETAGVPSWLSACVAGCPAPGGYAAILCGIVQTEHASAGLHGPQRRLVAEAAAWSIPIGILWGMSSLVAGLSIGLVAMLLLARVGWLLGCVPRDDLHGAEALALTATLARLGTPPADAVRGGAARRNLAASTWRDLPHSREEMAAALALQPLPAALLMRGELADAAARAAAHCARRSARVAAKRRWLVHALGLAATGAALAVLVS